MSSNARTVLEWTFEPRDFFEEPVALSYRGGEITVAEGKARGEFDARYFGEGRAFRDAAHDYLKELFLAQQILVHSRYEVSAASMSCEHADGRRETFFVEGGQLKLSGGSADFIVRNAEENIVQDTKAERLGHQADFRAGVSRLLPNDPLLKRMLQSFRNALSDRNNLLVHLSEVREALKTACGNDARAKEVAEVSGECWKKFGKMANDLPLLEGRHRGRKDRLRNATPEETDWALCFAQKLIEGYVRFRIKQT